jgi:hypothetical protein
MAGPWKPSRPSEWGTGGVRPAEWEGIDTEPFAADPPAREVEEAPEPPPPLPGRCVITCVTPVYARRRGLVVKHGEGWLERTACPICGGRAVVELARPVMECDECGGSGHVAHLETGEPRGPGAFRLALGQAREALRIRPKEAS